MHDNVLYDSDERPMSCFVNIRYRFDNHQILSSMSIQYDWYKTPVPGRQADEENEEVALHPRIHYNGSLDTPTLIRYIRQSSSLTEGDVIAVLSALSSYLSYGLADGKRVHLEGIGYFYPKLTTTERVTASTKHKWNKVKFKGIEFEADKQLKKGLGTLKMTSVSNKPNPSVLTADEIDKALSAYLSTHAYFRRRDLQKLCGLAVTTACRHIDRLKKAGRIRNNGLPYQPIYVKVGEW